MHRRPQVAGLPDLNPEQLRAVTHTGGPCLVLAGAGSGKTRVITHRIAYLIEQLGASPASICAVTFTNKAAREMRRRVTDMVGQPPDDLWLLTFHALGLRLLRRFATGTPDLVTGFRVYDRGDALTVWRACQAELGVDAREFPPSQLFELCSRAVNQLQDTAAWNQPESSPERRLAAQIHAKYKRRMAEAGAVDFDDLLLRPLQLMAENRDLAKAVDGRFEHLLIDEYQDTNRLQYRLIRQLMGPESELMVVGDEDQSIYRWRGADLANVLEFQADFPGATILRLERNYRSTQPILAAANSLVSHNRERLGKQLWCEETGGPLPIYRPCSTDRAEAAWVTDEVEKLLRAGTPASDIGVLMRTNAQSRSFEEELSSRSIPCRVVGGPSFFGLAVVRDVIAYLRLLLRPDDVSFRRAVAIPSRGVGTATLSALADAIPGLGVAASFETLVRSNEPRVALLEAGCPAQAIPGLLAFARTLRELRTKLDILDLPLLIQEVAHRTHGVVDDRSSLKANLSPSEKQGGELHELIASAADHGGKGAASLAEYLDRIALVTTIEPRSSRHSGVHLLTVHAAKGLEFDTVFVAGLEEDLFPHFSSIVGGQLEEERRLCYVALTRARRRLLLSSARLRSLHGKRRLREPSRFLSEIDPRCLQIEPGDVPEHLHAASAAANHKVVTGPGSGPAGRPQATDLAPGARVVHPMFGPGRVISCQGHATKLKVKVRFDVAGIKQLLARYAKLEIVTDR